MACSNSSKASVMDIALPLDRQYGFWLGIMNIGERAAP
jgi:spore maturation protein SpmA